MTRLRQECFRIPLPFGRNLRQQQAALPALLHDEAVTPDLDVVGAGDRLERPEDGQLDVECREFGRGDARKPRVGAAGGDRTSEHHVAERLVASMCPMQPRSSPCL